MCTKTFVSNKDQMSETSLSVKEFHEKLVMKNNPNRVEMLLQAFRSHSPNYSGVFPMLRIDDINLLLHNIEIYEEEKGSQQNLKFLRKIKSKLKKQEKIVEKMKQSEVHEVLQQCQNQVSCINQYYLCNQIIAFIALIADILSLIALVLNLNFQSVDESGNTTINALAVFNVIGLIILLCGIIWIIVRQYLQRKEAATPLSQHVSEALSLTNSILQEYYSGTPQEPDRNQMGGQERSSENIRQQKMTEVQPT